MTACKGYVYLNLIIITLGDLCAQDLGSIGKENPISLTGGIVADSRFYRAIGIENRNAPFISTLSGNINLSFMDIIHIPVSFSLGNQRSDFTSSRQSFNRFGISPYYKWIKLHIGYRNLTFSPFTLAGHTFLGGGMEMTPGKFRFSALYGRFLEATPYDSTTQELGYRRMGFGAKVGYGTNSDFIDLMLFKAKDDANSIVVPVEPHKPPSENIVFGMHIRKKLFKSASVEINYASSAYTRDINALKSSSNRFSIYELTDQLFTPRISTKYKEAIKVGISVGLKSYDVRLSFKRIDNDYETMGAYFFNNDIQEASVNLSTQFLNNKIKLTTSLGKQQDNLANTEVTTLHRTASALNIIFTPNDQFSLGGNYSNFISNLVFRTDPVNDSLSFAQISENTGFNVVYNRGNRSLIKTLSLNASYQTAYHNKSDENLQLTTSQIYSTTVAYRYSFSPRNFSTSLSFNYNQNELSGTKTNRLGTTLTANKALMGKKLQLNFSTGVFANINGEQLLYRNINNRLSLRYRYRNSHNFSFNLGSIHKVAAIKDVNSFSEFTALISYSFQFDVLNKLIKAMRKEGKNE